MFLQTDRPQTGFASVDKPWLKYYSEEAINAALPECTIYEYLMANNRDYPGDVAISYFSRKITFGELFKQIDRCANALSAIGVKPGEIVTVALPSIPEALYLVYALNKIGAVANMIHPLAGENEIIHYLNEVNSRVAFLFDGTYRIIQNSIHQTGVEKAIIITAGESLPAGLKVFFRLKTGSLKLSDKTFCTWKQFLAAGKAAKAEAAEKDIHTTAIISHTGGTTGEPKGVMCSDYNVNALMHQIVSGFDYDRHGCSLVVLPPFINYSLVEAMLAMLAIGYELVLIPDYKPDQFAVYLSKYHPSVVLSIPPYWEALLTCEKTEDLDLSCFEHIYYGGEGMTPEKEISINAFLTAHGSKSELCKGLGSTELVAAATQSSPDNNMIGSVGIPLVKTNCKIVDTITMEELPYQENGEICFSGPSLMLGYYNHPNETADVIKTLENGERWLRTGDVGHLDENGVLYVTGRIKRIFMTKGRDEQITKVFPGRVESALSRSAAVAMCCVIGVPDAERINYPKAFVVLRNDIVQSEAVTEEILHFCREELPEYMVPEVVEYVDDLPRTERGKIDYRALEKTVVSESADVKKSEE